MERPWWCSLTVTGDGSVQTPASAASACSRAVLWSALPFGARGTSATNTTWRGALYPASSALTAATISPGRPSAPGSSGDDGGDGLPEALVVDADDEAVDDAGDALDGLLDLLGEDLLAAGVDDLVAAAEQDQRAVGGDLGHVAGERVA